MLLGRHDATGLRHRFEDGRPIERLHRERVDDLGGDARIGQRVGGGERLADLHAVGHDGDIAPLAQHVGATEFQLHLVVVDAGHGGAAHAHVDGARRGGGEAQGGAGGGVVGGHEHAHAGKTAHEGDVLEHLVRAAVGAHGDARMGGGDLHVQVRVAHGVADLVVGAPGAEHGKRARERDVAGQREARGHVDHVLLGDAAVEQAPGVSRVGELLGGGRAGQVGIYRHDEHALGGELRQRGAVRGARGLLLGSGLGVCEFHHGGPPIPRRRTAPPEPSQVPRASAPCRASRPDFP